jgi:histidine ammonia-lyase
MSMQTLQELLRCVSSLSRPKLWHSCIDRIEEENSHLRRLVNKQGIRIYGLNTLVGHRDGEHIDISSLASLQEDILHSHAIGQPPYYSKYAALCITYAKLYSWSAGQSGVSPALFNSVSELATSGEFFPNVPTGYSYSSGDVVPAAHWARDILSILKDKKQYSAQPGEVMAIINGSFVQLGYAASLVEKLSKCWSLFIASSTIVNVGTKANGSNLYFFSTAERPWTCETIEYIKSFRNTSATDKGTQDPISIRAIPQVVDTLCNSIEDFMREINYSLFKPSGNPLFNIDSELPISQASFLCPVLTIKTEGVIESILFAMWSMVGRVNHWLSGNVEGIPKDASCSHSTLGLIQYPKIMMAKLENSRMNYGRRVFASGSQTSYGTEDLWTNGVLTLNQLDGLLNEFFDFCAHEIYIAVYLHKHHNFRTINGDELLDYCSGCVSVEEVKDNINTYISRGGLNDIYEIFPIKT